jgi:hypothetical protein
MRFASSVSRAATSSVSALASGRLSRPARIQRWGAAFDAPVKYGHPMNSNTVSVVGSSSGCSGASAHPLWHRPRPNPSVKGTSCGKPQAAPYLER